jgi:hypothetical protein
VLYLSFTLLPYSDKVGASTALSGCCHSGQQVFLHLTSAPLVRVEVYDHLCFGFCCPELVAHTVARHQPAARALVRQAQVLVNKCAASAVLFKAWDIFAGKEVSQCFSCCLAGFSCCLQLLY